MVTCGWWEPKFVSRSWENVANSEVSVSFNVAFSTAELGECWCVYFDASNEPLVEFQSWAPGYWMLSSVKDVAEYEVLLYEGARY